MHFTENTIADVDTYMAELDTVRTQGFAECQEEIEQGVYSIAIPVSADKQRVPEFSIGLVGPTALMRLNPPQQLQACLLGVSRELGNWLHRDAPAEQQPPTKTRGK